MYRAILARRFFLHHALIGVEGLVSAVPQVTDECVLQQGVRGDEEAVENGLTDLAPGRRYLGRHSGDALIPQICRKKLEAGGLC